MAIIKPFAGLFYNKKIIENIGDVTAPPYDVISQKEQKELYLKHKFNIVRLILGKEYKSDNEKNNRYIRARELYEKWQKYNILCKDEIPSFYYYTQEYSISGKILERKGFIALLKIADFNEKVVFPHEKTLSKPFEDRVNLIRECKANFSPIFMLYSDKKDSINELFNPFLKKNAFFDVINKENIRHKLWKISDGNVISYIKKTFRNKSLIIADGHHRYSASIRVRNYIREKISKTNSENPFDYVMVYLSCLEDKGLSVLPIHRLIYGLKNFDKQTILKKLSVYFNIEIYSLKKESNENELSRLKEEILKSSNNVFTLYFRSDDRFYILYGIRDKINAFINNSDVSPELAKLDVVVFHKIICEKILGISKRAQEKEQNIMYIKGDEDINNVIKRKDYQMAFFLNPLNASDIFDVVKNGRLLPQKTTFFYPKLISGFVINRMEGI